LRSIVHLAVASAGNLEEKARPTSPVFPGDDQWTVEDSVINNWHEVGECVVL
jgi:hypothetical protein